jgi:hypothetical protein
MTPGNKILNRKSWIDWIYVKWQTARRYHQSSPTSRKNTKHLVCIYLHVLITCHAIEIEEVIRQASEREVLRTKSAFVRPRRPSSCHDFDGGGSASTQQRNLPLQRTWAWAPAKEAEPAGGDGPRCWIDECVSELGVEAANATHWGWEGGDLVMIAFWAGHCASELTESGKVPCIFQDSHDCGRRQCDPVLWQPYYVVFLVSRFPQCDPVVWRIPELIVIDSFTIIFWKVYLLIWLCLWLLPWLLSMANPVTMAEDVLLLSCLIKLNGQDVSNLWHQTFFMTYELVYNTSKDGIY